MRLFSLSLFILTSPTTSLQLRIASIESITAPLNLELGATHQFLVATQQWNDRDTVNLPHDALQAATSICPSLNITLLPLCNDQDGIRIASDRAFKRIYANSPIHAVVGLTRLEHASTIALLASAAPPPQPIVLSHAAASSALSNKWLYPMFARVSLSDQDVSTAVVGLVKQLGFKYVGLLYTADRIDAAGALKLLFSGAGIDTDDLSLSTPSALRDVFNIDVRIYVLVLGNEDREEDERIINVLTDLSLTSPPPPQPRQWLMAFTTMDMQSQAFSPSATAFLQGSMWLQPGVVVSSSSPTFTVPVTLQPGMCFDEGQMPISFNSTHPLLPASVNAYDTIMALALAACVQDTSYVVNGTSLFNRLVNLNFAGMSGRVAFTGASGDRDATVLTNDGLQIPLLMVNNNVSITPITVALWNSSLGTFNIANFSTFRATIPAELIIPPLTQSQLAFSTFLGVTIQVVFMWIICIVCGVWAFVTMRALAKNRTKGPPSTTTTQPRAPPNSLASSAAMTQSGTVAVGKNPIIKPLSEGPLVLVAFGMILEVAALLAALGAEDAQATYLWNPAVACNAQLPLYFCGNVLIEFALFQRVLHTILSGYAARRAQFELRIALVLFILLMLVLFPVWWAISPFRMIVVVEFAIRNVPVVTTTQCALDVPSGGAVLAGFVLGLFSLIQAILTHTAYRLTRVRSSHRKDVQVLDLIVTTRSQIFFISLPIFFALWNTPFGRIGVMELLVNVSWLLCVVLVFMEKWWVTHLEKSIVDLVFHTTITGEGHTSAVKFNNNNGAAGGRMLAAMPPPETEERTFKKVEASTKEVVHRGGSTSAAAMVPSEIIVEE